MELEALKEKLGDETFATLETFVNDLTGQRDQARNESITGRKGLKSQVDQLTAQQVSLMDRLGLESLDDLENLPDAKGAADAAKQYDAKLKRAERERDTALASESAINTKYLESTKRVALGEALNAHEFIAKDVVSDFISHRLVWEGDELLFKQDDGNLVSVKDGVAGIAKNRPELLKPTGAGGAGVRSTNARGNGEQTTMTRAEFESLSPAKRMEVSKDGVTLQ